MVREMVGGCCVCLDERGWNENPLVYCDGSGCNVAVHQACYGIVKVPSGPWFCCKCRSQERVARVKCELCPSKEGALKRTDNVGWAHVVCALYIPEVRFGDVSTMEPIIFSSVPHERFLKTCYICEENGRESKTSNGACMNCHKAGCKLSFHVTCAQSKRLLCEEASVNGHVQYVGYCSTHWSRRFKQPSVTPHITEAEVKTHAKERKGRSRTDSTSSNTSVEIVKRGRKPKLVDVVSLDDKSSDNRLEAISPVTADEAVFENHPSSKAAAVPNGQASCKESASSHSFSVNGILSNDKSKMSSPLNTPVTNHLKDSSKPFDVSGPTNVHDKKESQSRHKSELKIRKSSEKEKLKKLKNKINGYKELNKEKKKDKEILSKDVERKKKDKHIEKSIEKKAKGHAKEKINEKKRKFPQPSQLGLLENGKVSSWDSVTPKYDEPPDNFQQFLEHQWNQSAQFLTAKAEHFDVASLLGCLHQLKADNTKLEKKLLSLQSRRDRLLGVNARLAASITESNLLGNGKIQSPLSSMLSKLNDSPTASKPKKSKKSQKKSPELDHHNAASPDLALLAATSARLGGSSRDTFADLSVPSDEKPPTLQHTEHNTLMQPDATSHIHGELIPNRSNFHAQMDFLANSSTKQR
ncbi:zinc finger protein zfp-1-like [Hydractinia symbiolongicarpus]|uniref:zinc finger protein zfp-1-like n=1 Tax=Hydractinia symbiolongicarpus TaxID=13093 RepID=UPI00254D79CB|nr:zinc finger protein zfp-1-like [Hydractinia symbiolongicarpus]